MYHITAAANSPTCEESLISHFHWCYINMALTLVELILSSF